LIRLCGCVGVIWHCNFPLVVRCMYKEINMIWWIGTDSMLAGGQNIVGVFKRCKTNRLLIPWLQFWWSRFRLFIIIRWMRSRMNPRKTNSDKSRVFFGIFKRCNNENKLLFWLLLRWSSMRLLVIIPWVGSRINPRIILINPQTQPGPAATGPICLEGLGWPYSQVPMHSFLI